LIGTLLAIFGSVIVSISLSIQKYSHVTLAGTKEQRTFYNTKTWWSGFVFICIGEGANFVSYAFAPIAVVAPLNAVSVLTSSILGFLFLREKSKAKDFAKNHGLAFLGYIFIIGGTYLFVSFGPNSHEKLQAENIVKHLIGWPVLLYMLLEIIAFCLLLYFYKQHNANYLVVVLLLVALLGSVTVITVKAVSGMLLLTLEGSMQLDYPIFSVMFVCMVASVIFQARFLSQACNLHDPSLAACVNYIFSTIFAVVAGELQLLRACKHDHNMSQNFSSFHPQVPFSTWSFRRKIHFLPHGLHQSCCGASSPSPRPDWSVRAAVGVSLVPPAHGSAGGVYAVTMPPMIIHGQQTPTHLTAPTKITASPIRLTQQSDGKILVSFRL
uniref:NIPA like domain containing 3 n=1 Tax=Xiphophorus couchianus TaxID=32473 RepID=A0A3B5L984_9TELE